MRQLSVSTGLILVIALLVFVDPISAGRHEGHGDPPNDPGSSSGWRSNLPRPLRNSDYYDQGRPDPIRVELGRLLFFDKLLAGNLNISCATCHHPLASTGDDLSLPVGEGGSGLALDRDTGTGSEAIHERVPRNAPPVFNLGTKRFRVMFDDGRVTPNRSHPSGFNSPAGDDLPPGLDNVLAVQAMFPVTSGAEMAGQPGENAVADATAAGNLTRVWNLLAKRLRAIPLYVDLFRKAYPGEISSARDITFVHAANAIAAFEAKAWRSDRSPFDRYLHGDRAAMSPAAKRGMKSFYGKFGCSECHGGMNLTDLKYHAIAMPQLGPGKGHGPDGLEDWGREGVTGNSSDRFKFRTPTLRNVALTGPWGHSGAFSSLRAIVEHILDPLVSLENYDTGQTVLPSRPDLDAIDFVVHEDPVRRDAIADACEVTSPPGSHSRRKVNDLIAFLNALTDPRMVDLRRDIPEAVPSGLPVPD